MKAKTIHKKAHQGKKLRPKVGADARLPFVEHLYELRRRVVYVAISILAWSTFAYFIQQQIVAFLLRPSRGQQFIYTSPGGGINFLFTVCMYVGIALSTPIIIHQVLGFFAPLIKTPTHHLIIRYSGLSAVLAVVGFCFGYFLGLPSALHFLSHQFTTDQIHALFTIQEYMSFLAIYLLGFVLLFQIPVIVLFINRIRPLPPRKLLGAERYVAAASIIVAMIMAPTPNIISQLIIAVPVILMYNLSILIVWRNNRFGSRSKRIIELLERDQQVQTARLRMPKTFLPVEPLEQPRRLVVDQPSSVATIIQVRLTPA